MAPSLSKSPATAVVPLPHGPQTSNNLIPMLPKNRRDGARFDPRGAILAGVFEMTIGASL
jgi:hypothetical protein